MRERYVYSMGQVERIDSNHFNLSLKTQAGTYPSPYCTYDCYRSTAREDEPLLSTYNTCTFCYQTGGPLWEGGGETGAFWP